MVDHYKHEHGCGCGGKTKATQQEKPDFTIDRAGARPHEFACCGDHARQDQSNDQGCCGGSHSKKPKARPELAAEACCGGNSHD